MTLKVNGVTRQQGTTSDMVFDVNYIVWYLSQIMVLEPGDVVNTVRLPGSRSATMTWRTSKPAT